MRAARLARIAAALGALGPAAVRAADPPPPAPAPPPRIAVRISYVLGSGAKHCPPEQALHDEVARRMGYDPFTADAPDRIVATLQGSRQVAAQDIRPPQRRLRRSRPGDGDLYQRQIPASCRAPSDHDAQRFTATGAIRRIVLDRPVVLCCNFNIAEPSTLRGFSSTVRGCSPAISTVRADPRLSCRARPQPARGVRLCAPSRLCGSASRRIRWPSFSIALEGRADAPASPPRLPSATIGTIMVGGSVVSGWHVAPVARWPWFFLMMGGVFTTAAVLGHGEGIPAANQDVDLYVGTGPRVGVNLRLGSRFIASVYGDAVVSIKPARARIGGMEVWGTAPVAGDVGGAFFALF